MFLVTGAAGLVGRPLVDLLVAEGAKVRAVTRDPRAAALPDGVEVVEGDPSQPATLGSALRGVTGLFVNPRSVGRAADELLALAGEAGVRRVVAMSALNVDYDFDLQPSRLRGEFNKEVEAAAVASGLEWTALRSGYYAMNAARSWASQIRIGDVVRSPYASAHWAPLHERDIAAVGVRALLDDDLLGRKPELTGPQCLTQEAMVTMIGEVIGRPLRYEEAPAEVAKQGMMQSGMPDSLAENFLRLQARSYLQPGLVTGEVERILGRPALPFAEWAAEHVADFQG